MPNALLVYPEQPPTYWGADYALEMFEEANSGPVPEVEDIRSRRRMSFERAREHYKSVPDEFRYRGDGLDHALDSFRRAVDARADEFARSAVI